MCFDVRTTRELFDERLITGSQGEENRRSNPRNKQGISATARLHCITNQEGCNFGLVAMQ